MGRRDFSMRGFRVFVALLLSFFALLLSFFAGLRSRAALLRSRNDLPPVPAAVLVPVAVAAGFSLSAFRPVFTSASIVLLAGAAMYRFSGLLRNGGDATFKKKHKQIHRRL